jgi:hypothetical protein
MKFTDYMAAGLVVSGTRVGELQRLALAAQGSVSLSDPDQESWETSLQALVGTSRPTVPPAALQWAPIVKALEAYYESLEPIPEVI